MNDKITEIKEALVKATPSPWIYQQGGYAKDSIVHQEHNDDLICRVSENTDGDGHFIAKSPEYITYLLQLVETQSKALEFYESRWNHDVQLEDVGLTPMQIDRGQKAREALSII